MVLNADLLQHLFGASALDEVSEDSMHTLIGQYPYFVHFHWLAAIKKWNHSHDQNDLQEAGAYAFNPSRLKQYVSGISARVAGDEVERDIQDEEKHGRSAEVPLHVDNAAEKEFKRPDASMESSEILENRVEEAPGKAKLSPESVIQPLFTQDYFAYTGARLPEQIENDKKPTIEQLRSFTGWLRTMKHPVVDSADPDLEGEKTDPEADKEGIAENEVVTETMAEVRASKGHYDKAIAIYEKLSLSNPEKSAYFAQKIEALKNK